MNQAICTCNCANKGPHAYHAQDCPMSSDAGSLRAKLETAQKMHRHYSALADRWIASCQLWEGKFHAVKRENNALRKKLYPNK